MYNKDERVVSEYISREKASSVGTLEMARFLPSVIEIAYLFAFHENKKCLSVCVHLKSAT